MDFGLREALLLLGIVGILLIILDGFRRKFQSRTLRDETLPGEGREDAEWDLFKGELTGSARPVKRDGDDDVDGLEGMSAQTPVETAVGSEGAGKARRVARTTDDAESAVPATAEDPSVDFTLGGAESGTSDDAGDDPSTAAVGNAATEEPPRVDFEDVIVINVMARPRDELAGNDLLRALLSVGLRYGSMNIFHRHEQLTGKGSVLFSAVNCVEPGTFDLNRMEDFRSPGICLFLKLPGPKRSLYAFEQMVDSARKVANMLGAELKDEHHSVLTPQTIEHYRQRVLDFERKMLSHRATQR